MYYTVIIYSSNLRTLDKCRKHSPAARVFYICLVFSLANACRVLSQCNTTLRLLYLLNKKNIEVSSAVNKIPTIELIVSNCFVGADILRLYFHGDICPGSNNKGEREDSF